MSDDTPAPAQDFAARTAAAYVTEGSSVDIGRAVLDGTAYPQAIVQIPTAMCNRHGLIAGATGTGKTVTLQLLAEQLSAQGVPVFTADIKGDLTGLVKPAEPGSKITARIEQLELAYSPTGAPVQFWALGGQGPGVPVRATVSSFGPQLLAKVLGSNETQSSSLALVFYYADRQGLPLLDLVDLVDLLTYLISDEAKAELKTIGGLSSQTAGVLLRDLVELQQQDAELFFGEPEITIDDLMRTDPDGRGVISCLELAESRPIPRPTTTTSPRPSPSSASASHRHHPLRQRCANPRRLDQGPPTTVVDRRRRSRRREGPRRGQRPLGHLRTEVDRESARELLAKKMGVEAPPAAPSAGAPAAPGPQKGPKRNPARQSDPDPINERREEADDGNVVGDFLKSREGRATVNNVVRGVFDLLKKKR